MFRRSDCSWWMVSWIFLALIAGAQEKDPKATSPAPKATNDAQLLSVDRLFQSSEFQDRGWGPIQWRKDGKSYWIVARDANSKSIAIQTVDAVTGEKVDFVSADELVRAECPWKHVDSFHVADDESKVLFFTNTKRVWRMNTRGDYWVWDRSKKTLIKLGGDIEPSMMMFAKFSPDASRVAYVYKNNLYVQDLQSRKIDSLTTDGSDTIINGTSDWVYEEELSLRDAYRWSPDSRSIAYWQLDTQGVRTFFMINNTDDSYSKPIPILYPKVGETNAAGRIGIVDLVERKTRWIDLPGDPREHYVAQVEWNPHGSSLMLQQFNRLQNRNTVYRVAPDSLQLETLHVEEDPAWLENENPFRWIQGGQAFLWLSERSGWRNAYAVSSDKPKNVVVAGQVTQAPVVAGAFDVLQILSIDEANERVYFLASPENPTQQYLYSASLKGGDVQRVTPPSDSGWNTYQLAPMMGESKVRLAVHSVSSFDVPSRWELVSLPDHKVIRVLEDNSELRKKLATIALPTASFLRLPISDEIALDAWCLMPPPSDSLQKHPVLVHVYGEPHGQTVKDSWMGKQGLWHRMLAQKGCIVISIDNRGTMSPRGRSWRKAVHRQIGVLASQEQAAALDVFLDRHPMADRNRVGIWGWSGGGSMSLNAIFRYPEKYHAAIAVAPVPDQKLYDTIYQERYMGLPDENSKGYHDGSPIHYAHQLKGNLLLIHGTGDDNCHYQGIERLVNELIKHNKIFDVVPYPNRSHSINEGENTTRHLYHTMTNYLLNHLFE